MVRLVEVASIHHFLPYPWSSPHWLYSYRYISPGAYLKKEFVPGEMQMSILLEFSLTPILRHSVASTISSRSQIILLLVIHTAVVTGKCRRELLTFTSPYNLGHGKMGLSSPLSVPSSWQYCSTTHEDEQHGDLWALEKWCFDGGQRMKVGWDF